MIHLPLTSKASILALLKADMNQKIARGKQLQQNLPYNKKNAAYYAEIALKSEKEVDVLKEEVANLRNTIKDIEAVAEDKEAA